VCRHGFRYIKPASILDKSDHTIAGREGGKGSCCGDEGGVDRGDFHRLRVSLDAIRCLVRFVTFVLKGCAPMLLLVKYEGMPRYCAHCGLMRHVHLEYGIGEFTYKELQFGD
jgi:hypothetical protein